MGGEDSVDRPVAALTIRALRIPSSHGLTVRAGKKSFHLLGVAQSALPRHHLGCRLRVMRGTVTTRTRQVPESKVHAPRRLGAFLRVTLRALYFLDVCGMRELSDVAVA